MVQTGSHHLELVYQFLMQGTHFWVHKFLMDCQTHS